MAKPDDQYPDYTNHSPFWQKCQDATNGQRGIEAGRFLYLKPLVGQIVGNDTTAYDAYLDRGNYFNTTGRTVDAMVGLVFQSPMTREVPAAIEPWLDDISLSDEILTDFAQTLLNETLSTARCGLLIEQPETPAKLQTVAERQTSGAKALLCAVQNREHYQLAVCPAR